MPFVSYPASTRLSCQTLPHEQRGAYEEHESRGGLQGDKRIAAQTPAADDAASRLLEAAEPRP